jgi:hypothetical protein
LFHDCGNEENRQKDFDEVSLAEGLNETLSSTVPFKEDEDFEPCEELINFYDEDEIMEQPPYIVDDYLDDLIQICSCRQDWGCLIFVGDPIYDIEGTYQIKDT